MAETILYLTELLGLQVFDLKGKAIGQVKEAAIVPRVDSERVDRFLIGAGSSWLTIRHDQIQSIGLDGIRLGDERLTPFHADEDMLRMVRDLLDQQIIDAHGHKVVRVTDLTFEIRPTNGHMGLFIQEVDIGLRSVFRRLFQGVLPRTWIRRLQRYIQPNSIKWQDCNIIEVDPMRRLRLNLSSRQLEEMHPADLADIVEELGPEAREAVLTSIDSETAAETLSEVEMDIQASIVESLESEQAAKILEEMAPEEAAAVLQELEEEKSDEILEEMDSESADEVEELLDYDEHTAGAMMSVEYVSVNEEATVRDAIEAIRLAAESTEETNALFVSDAQGKLVGQVPLSRLLISHGDVMVKDLAANGEVFVPTDAREKKVVEYFDKYHPTILPVVDEAEALVGVIKADDIISILRKK